MSGYEPSTMRRSGPCIVTYLDPIWYRNPERRCWSCRGCQHLLIDGGLDACCEHPAMIASYGIPQHNHWCGGAMGAAVTVNDWFCPAISGAVFPLEQPAKDESREHIERAWEREDKVLHELKQWWLQKLDREVSR